MVQGPGAGLNTESTDGTLNFAIIGSHQEAAVFDCTGNDSITFIHASITTPANAMQAPQTGILTARNTTHADQMITLINCRIIGWFSIACYYNCNSEDDTLIRSHFYNYMPGPSTETRVYTLNNVFSVTSPFRGALPTNVSCVDHLDLGCLDQNSGGGASSDCIYLEASAGFASTAARPTRHRRRRPAVHCSMWI